VDGKHKSFTQWFIARLDIPLKEFKIQKEEVAKLKWISKEELKESLLKRPEEFITNIKEIFNILQDY
jgi:isopentenyldiphosphate isomerase